MKKGDLRKQEILRTAEALFCRKGYQQTSIQDILDRMNSSKGSFYHHFVSKEALLEGICAKRAEQIYSSASLLVDEASSPVKNLNQLLSGMIPFSGEKLSFLLMLLPVFRLPEGKMIKTGYCESLSELFFPAVVRQLERGHQAGEIFCTEPDLSAEIALSVVHQLWLRLCDMIIKAEENAYEEDFSEYMRVTDCYRQAIEHILSLPYGSVELTDIPTLRSITEQIHSHWGLL